MNWMSDWKPGRISEMSTIARKCKTQPSESENYEVMDANSYEMQAILYATMLQMHIPDVKVKVEKRLRKIPNGWRDMCLVSSLLNRLLEAIYRTMTPTQLNQVRRMLKDNELRIQRRPVTQSEESESISVSLADVVYLASATIDSQCSMCLKDRQEQKGCKLRKRLMGICPPKEIPENGNCPYLEAVLADE
jgi:hypothetical protein